MKEKRRMQNVSFRNVEEFLDFLPENQLAITQHLRELVLETIPEVQERLAFNVPYYRRHKDICFIWPGSVSWGNKTHEGVRFGFTQGFLIPDEFDFLDKGNRKQVFWHDFFALKEINDDILISYLAIATEIDESAHAHKKAQKR